MAVVEGGGAEEEEEGAPRDGWGLGRSTARSVCSSTLVLMSRKTNRFNIHE